jgi:hypothetical protein
MTTPSVEEAVARLTELAKGPDIGLTDFLPHLRALLADHANLRALLVEAGEGLGGFVAHYPMGINPFLDNAFRQARTLRDKIRKAAGG